MLIDGNLPAHFNIQSTRKEILTSSLAKYIRKLGHAALKVLKSLNNLPFHEHHVGTPFSL
jgi:hypothetical protein